MKLFKTNKDMEYSRLNDPLKLFRDVSIIGHYGKGNCEKRVEI